MPSSDSSSKLPRVFIDEVAPSVDGGRHAVKRCLGDALVVGADIYKDGHDLIGARVRFRPPGERDWQTAAMSYDFDFDRWSGSVPLDLLGRWEIAVEAWPDYFATWRTDLGKRLQAAQDVGAELLEGAALLRRARPGGAARKRLTEIAHLLADGARSQEERCVAALDPELAALMDGPLAPAHVTRSAPSLPVLVERERARLGAWYELFPRSQAPLGGRPRHGTFADAERRLPELAMLGFDVIYLPPVHPIGRSHRKGPNNSRTSSAGDPGSPWAIGAREGGHTAVHPELGTIDDFDRLVRAAAAHGIEVALDYALQCSPDHPWATEHPEWFHRRPDGSIRYAENPPKKYEDIYPINFWCEKESDRVALWEACRDIFLFWIEHGVRIFRVDNPHTKPFAFWEWCLRDVQERHPDVVFLSEAFTRPKRMLGLAKIGFSQSYTYFTWKNTSWELRDFLRMLLEPEWLECYRPNFFANTPDILHEYLQKGGRPAFRTRLLLAATLSPSYGIYSGFELCENVPLHEGSEEYLDSEKYQLRPRHWDAQDNIKPDIAQLNHLRRHHPALQRFDNLRILDCENPNIFWYRKKAGAEDLFIAVNLDPYAAQEAMVPVPIDELGLDADAPYRMRDLLTDTSYQWRGPRGYVRLDPRERAGHLFRFEAGGST